MASPSASPVPSPAEDFYRSVNGKWLDDPSIEIPKEYPRWGSFMILVDESLKAQIELLRGLGEQPEKVLAEMGGEGAKFAMIGSVWRASMERFSRWDDEKESEINPSIYASIFAELDAQREKLGVDSVASDGASDDFATKLGHFIAHNRRIGVGSPISLDKEANLEDSNSVILDLSPSGLSLPSRDYYLEDNFADQRGWFRDHLTKVAALLGENRLQDHFAERIIRIETKLALLRMKPAQSREFSEYYTITSLDELVSKLPELRHLKAKEANYGQDYKPLQTLDLGDDAAAVNSSTVPAIDMAAVRRFFDALVRELNLREILEKNFAANYPNGDPSAKTRMMVFDGDYFRRVFAVLFNEKNREDLLAYFQYQAIKAGAGFCSKALNVEVFDFYERKLRGTQEQKTSLKRTVGLINAWVGELVGELYVRKHFSPDDKKTLHEMIGQVINVMKGSLETNDWLTAPTKEKALQKLDKFVVKIGYPDKWRDYSRLTISEGDSLFEMDRKVTEFEFQDEFLDKVNTPKDKSKWEMTPQTVNAYFHPLNNEIVFPAAIIQPPFYHKSVDTIDFELGASSRVSHAQLVSAVNFGGIGAVIAHEITHGYDDQGRRFDANGNMADWWQPEDAELFVSKTKLMAAQADAYTFSDGNKQHNLNGQLTMGENLADLGGMSLALQALCRHSRTHDNVTAGSDDEKVLVAAFFRSWAAIWKCKQTNADKINQLATDPHSPTDFRANLVRNIDLFYEAFGVGEKDAMYVAPELRVKMW